MHRLHVLQKFVDLGHLWATVSYTLDHFKCVTIIIIISQNCCIGHETPWTNTRWMQGHCTCVKTIIFDTLRK